MRRESGTAAARGVTGACLALLLVLAACAGDGAGKRAIRPEFDLRDPDAGRRIAAVQHVRRAGDRRWLPELIEMLDDPDDGVRLVAGSALRALTGHDTQYRAFAPPEERRAQVLRWRQWHEAGGGSTAPATDGAAP